MPVPPLPCTCCSLSIVGVLSFLEDIALDRASLFSTRFIKGSSSELGSEIPAQIFFFYIIHVLKKCFFVMLIIAATIPCLFLGVLTCDSAFLFVFSFPDFILDLSFTKGVLSSSELLSKDEKCFQNLALNSTD